MTQGSSRDIDVVLIDVDGTLVDSNDAHAHAWVRAFAAHGHDIPYNTVRRAIGMGGDQLMPRVSGLAHDSAEGEQIARRRQAIFMDELLPGLHALPGASELIGALKTRGFTVVAASSANAKELRALLEIAGAKALLDDWTSSDDAETSKPAPDIIEAALHRAGGAAARAVMVGDTPYDIEAAARAGVPCIAFRSGGWADSDLQGALAIYDGPQDLLQHLPASVLAAAAPV